MPAGKTSKTFKIDRKFVDPKKCTFMDADWKDWRKKFIDHCAGSTGKRRRIVKAIGGDPQPTTQALLEQTPIGQEYTACDLAENLESFIMKHVSNTIYYERRHGWTNGEEGNGFAPWMVMFLEYEGDHRLIKMGRRRLFDKWGRCTTKEDIEQHNGWQENLYKHRTDLINNEEELFYRLPDVLPEDLGRK